MPKMARVVGSGTGPEPSGPVKTTLSRSGPAVTERLKGHRNSNFSFPVSAAVTSKVYVKCCFGSV